MPTGWEDAFSFPTWKDKWIASFFDVSVAFDSARTDLVFGFREGNAATSGMAVWLERDEVVPPPGFDVDDGDPNSFGDVGGPAGFNSGSEFLPGVYTGVGVTFNDSADQVWTISHAQ